ncbi:hypothetical protein M413DRAFT_239902 [Hebeloma cylindrosporum]|uniref:BTB domain-containing protein n=1 Tax=Hebeloma cylindrosporum TaxID=76867 RepID=A0A0C2YCC5_HEBCY|nr:hypothetical protein M413DRAFT_239902 [Hebeloma cylindrosporum h7]
MANTVPSSEFFWDNIFIKVEDTLFCVPRCEFVKSSEVFADMFLLPAGPGESTEGRVRDHPIVLEGYKKDEFTSLLKVMYPTAGSQISGTTLDLGLGKSEWVNVLKLSTIWNMEKIRTYAIHKLSTDFTLSPAEKILLARAHKVATWMYEGVSELVNSNPKPTIEELGAFGWETAARILWIRDSFPPNLNILTFKRDDIKCGYCSSSSSLIDGAYNCYSCGRSIPPDAELTIPGSGPTVVLRDIRCPHITCRGTVFHTIYVRCNSCSTTHGADHNARIIRKTGLKELIEDSFGEEVRR